MVKLEPLAISDADWVFALTSNPKVAEYMRFDTHTRREEAVCLIQEYTEHGNWGWRITGFSTDVGAGEAAPYEPYGVAALKRGETEGEYSISVFLAPEYWNKGLSTAVIKELMQIACEKGIRILTAYIIEENMGSRRVVEKCGFEVKEVLHFPDLGSGLYVYDYIFK